MEDEFIITRVLDRIDNLDDKMDKKMDSLGKEITQCKVDIEGVQKDLTNHLNNKKDESDSSKRKIYYVIALLTISFTAYEALVRIL